MKYDILLFDLIGVLVKDSDQTTAAVLDAVGMTEEGLWQFWISSPTVRDFDSGRISSQAFGENMVEDLNLSISASEFLELFRSWVGGLYEGTETLLSELSKRFRLGCFSNNNEIMWPQIRDQLGMGRLLNDYFLSHEMGMLKPDIAAFEHVIEKLEMAPNRIVFFDDLEANVKAARQVGMNSYVTRGLPDLREQLDLLGLL